MEIYRSYSLSKGFYFVLSLVLVCAIGLSDFLTRERISFYVFYSLPIFLAAWYVGRWAGVIVCFFASVTWFLVDLGDYPYAEALTHIDALIRFVFFMGISLVLTALRNALDSQRSLASTDFLTGLSNRRTLIQRAREEIDRARRYGHPLTIAYLDLDNFKPVNDQYGHHTGDQLLQVIARKIREETRSSDILARIGGDEFVILFPEIDAASAKTALENLKAKLSHTFEAQTYRITFSIGAATYLKPPHSPEEMIKKADAAMYCAKGLGKDTIQHEQVVSDAELS
jgi:diguanylate cyclase (GGDEF)-like protein